MGDIERDQPVKLIKSMAAKLPVCRALHDWAKWYHENKRETLDPLQMTVDTDYDDQENLATI